MLIDIDKHKDFRGFFARSFCADTLAKEGLTHVFVQSNISFTLSKGTIRGFHYQAAPHEEDKLVRCVKGMIYDVIVDLRKDSPTYKQSFSVVLNSEDYRSLYIPKGCAHGFQTLVDDCEVNYQMSHEHVADSAKGFRWNDPCIDVEWPLPEPILNERDANYPDYKF